MLAGRLGSKDASIATSSVTTTNRIFVIETPDPSAAMPNRAMANHRRLSHRKRPCQHNRPGRLASYALAGANTKGRSSRGSAIAATARLGRGTTTVYPMTHAPIRLCEAATPPALLAANTFSSTSSLFRLGRPCLSLSQAKYWPQRLAQPFPQGTGYFLLNSFSGPCNSLTHAQRCHPFLARAPSSSLRHSSSPLLSRRWASFAPLGHVSSRRFWTSHHFGPRTIWAPSLCRATSIFWAARQFWAASNIITRS